MKHEACNKSSRLRTIAASYIHRTYNVLALRERSVTQVSLLVKVTCHGDVPEMLIDSYE